MRAAAAAAVAFFSFSVCACGDQFQTPTAYDEAPDVCGDDGARDQVLSDCRSAGDCGGVLGFAGTLEQRDVAVGAPLDASLFTDADTGDVVFVDTIEAEGQSPYFKFVAKLVALGGELGTDHTTRDLRVDRAASSAEDPYNDDRVGVELRLTTTSESESFSGDTGGSLVIEEQTDRSVSGAFEVTFGEDALAGCFTFLPTSRVTVQVETE